MKKQYLVQLSTRITIGTAQALDAYAAASCEGKGRIIEAAIKAYIKQREVK